MADLTTLGAVQAYGQISPSDTVTAGILSSLISSVSQWFLGQINRGALLQAQYTEVRNGQGGDSLTLMNYPITSVTSVTVDGNAMPAAVIGTTPGYVWDQFTLWLTGGYRFRRGRGNVQIVYEAGYATVPLDIQQAVNQQVLFTFRQSANLGSVSQSANGILTVAFSQKDIAPGVQTVIDSYKDRAVVGI